MTLRKLLFMTSLIFYSSAQTWASTDLERCQLLLTYGTAPISLTQVTNEYYARTVWLYAYLNQQGTLEITGLVTDQNFKLIAIWQGGLANRYELRGLMLQQKQEAQIEQNGNQMIHPIVIAGLTTHIDNPSIERVLSDLAQGFPYEPFRLKNLKLALKEIFGVIVESTRREYISVSPSLNQAITALMEYRSLRSFIAPYRGTSMTQLEVDSENLSRREATLQNQDGLDE